MDKMYCQVFSSGFSEKDDFFSMADRLFFHNYYCLYNIPFGGVIQFPYNTPLGYYTASV